MTDKELLELAAKAAAVKGCFVEAFPEDGYPAYSCGIGSYASQLPLWNPLANDGEALRLAVKLQMEILVEEIRISVYSELTVEKWEMYPADRLATTRRLIVETAAEIGKAMP